MSADYKGIPSDTQNTIQPNGYCANVISGTNPESGDAITPWYGPYCEQKPDKACMVLSRLSRLESVWVLMMWMTCAVR